MPIEDVVEIIDACEDRHITNEELELLYPEFFEYSYSMGDE